MRLLLAFEGECPHPTDLGVVVLPLLLERFFFRQGGTELVFTGPPFPVICRPFFLFFLRGARGRDPFGFNQFFSYFDVYYR